MILLNNIEIRHLPEFTKSREVMREKFLESFTLEQRLAGLTSEEMERLRNFLNN